MENYTWFKVSEAAEKMNVSRGVLYKMIRRGLLPCYKIGRAIRLRPEDIEKLKEAACG